MIFAFCVEEYEERQKIAIVLGLGIVEEAPVFCDTLEGERRRKQNYKLVPTKMLCPLPISHSLKSKGDVHNYFPMLLLRDHSPSWSSHPKGYPPPKSGFITEMVVSRLAGDEVLLS